MQKHCFLFIIDRLPPTNKFLPYINSPLISSEKISENIVDNILSFSFSGGMFYCPACGLSWKISHVHWKKCVSFLGMDRHIFYGYIIYMHIYILKTLKLFYTLKTVIPRELLIQVQSLASHMVPQVLLGIIPQCRASSVIPEHCWFWSQNFKNKSIN